MWRVITSTFAALTLVSSVAGAQQPCTTDAGRVVSEVYRHMLERSPDPAAQSWAQRLSNGQMTVKEFVRDVAKSPEYMQRFGRTEAGEGQPYERAVARLYRHVLGRQPDSGGQRYWADTAQQRGLDAVVDGLVGSTEYNNQFGDWGVPGSGGLRFCATNQSGASSRLDNRRFGGMDTNRDGVVSRNEWQGSSRSFRVHDWNNDGVLSGDEIDAARYRQGRNVEYEDFDRAEDFAYLDTNNNNRIERREWHAGALAFNTLDRNNDGVLSRGEFVRGADTAPTSGQSIGVAADRQWTDTGINVVAGQTITFSADGQIRLARDTNDVVNAQGAEGHVADATMPNARIGGLVARFGNSAPVFIGESRTLRAPRSGRLYLGINDSYFDDNTGQFNVRIDTN